MLLYWATIHLETPAVSSRKQNIITPGMRSTYPERTVLWKQEEASTLNQSYGSRCRCSGSRYQQPNRRREPETNAGIALHLISQDTPVL